MIRLMSSLGVVRTAICVIIEYPCVVITGQAFFSLHGFLILNIGDEKINRSGILDNRKHLHLFHFFRCSVSPAQFIILKGNLLVLAR